MRRYKVVCHDCDTDTKFGSETAAKRYARAHERNNPDHNVGHSRTTPLR